MALLLRTSTSVLVLTCSLFIFRARFSVITHIRAPGSQGGLIAASRTHTVQKAVRIGHRINELMPGYSFQAFGHIGRYWARQTYRRDWAAPCSIGALMRGDVDALERRKRAQYSKSAHPPYWLQLRCCPKLGSAALASRRYKYGTGPRMTRGAQWPTACILRGTRLVYIVHRRRAGAARVGGPSNKGGGGAAVT